MPTFAVREAGVRRGRKGARLAPRAAWRVTALAALVGTVGCGERVVRPPPPPFAKAEIPEVAMPTEGARAGHGLVILDVPGERAEAFVCYGAPNGKHGLATCFARRPLCAHLPCVAELPLGEQRLVFRSIVDATRESTADVTVGRDVVVVRHALGLRREHRSLASAGAAGLLVGGPVTVLGGAVLVGNELATLDGESSAGPAQAAAATSVVVGAAFLAAGVTLSILGRPETQKGSTTTTTSPRLGPTPAASGAPTGLTFRF